jgi:hypothetical protein
MLKQGDELDMKSQRISNVADPTDPQNAATMNYIESVLARKKLGSQLFPPELLIYLKFI